ncbi:hypothetical protein B484DRAFT_414720 [Ochromonadaceae sp. CCMP2298]|nr:hypothetical protein B484DRAFT_414720 [Ochromonadaceae sp. CCMP2298]
MLCSRPPVPNNMLGSIFRKKSDIESPKKGSVTSVGSGVGVGGVGGVGVGGTGVLGGVGALFKSDVRAKSVDSGISPLRSFASPVQAGVEDFVARTKKTAAYLRLLLHAQRCSGCGKASCQKTSAVLAHLEQCADLMCKPTDPPHPGEWGEWE